MEHFLLVSCKQLEWSESFKETIKLENKSVFHFWIFCITYGRSVFYHYFLNLTFIRKIGWKSYFQIISKKPNCYNYNGTFSIIYEHKHLIKLKKQPQPGFWKIDRNAYNSSLHLKLPAMFINVFLSILKSCGVRPCACHNSPLPNLC